MTALSRRDIYQAIVPLTFLFDSGLVKEKPAGTYHQGIEATFIVTVAPPPTTIIIFQGRTGKIDSSFYWMNIENYLSQGAAILVMPEIGLLEQ